MFALQKNLNPNIQFYSQAQVSAVRDSMYYDSVCLKADLAFKQLIIIGHGHQLASNAEVKKNHEWKKPLLQKSVEYILDSVRAPKIFNIENLQHNGRIPEIKFVGESEKILTSNAQNLAFSVVRQPYGFDTYQTQYHSEEQKNYVPNHVLKSDKSSFKYAAIKPSDATWMDWVPDSYYPIGVTTHTLIYTLNELNCNKPTSLTSDVIYVEIGKTDLFTVINSLKQMGFHYNRYIVAACRGLSSKSKRYILTLDQIIQRQYTDPQYKAEQEFKFFSLQSLKKALKQRIAFLTQIPQTQIQAEQIFELQTLKRKSVSLKLDLKISEIEIKLLNQNENFISLQHDLRQSVVHLEKEFHGLLNGWISNILEHIEDKIEAMKKFFSQNPNILFFHPNNKFPNKNDLITHYAYLKNALLVLDALQTTRTTTG